MNSQENLWAQRSCPEGNYSIIGLPWEVRKISNKQSNSTPKRSRERTKNKAQRMQRKRNNKD